MPLPRFGILLVLVVVHALIAGGEITTYHTLAVWHGFWVAIGLAAFAYLGFFYRFIGPQYDYTTHSVQEIGDEITEVYLAPAGRPLRPQPAQFVYISFDADAVSKEPRPFSISSPPDARHLRLSIKQLGDWTEDVSEIKVGKSALLDRRLPEYLFMICGPRPMMDDLGAFLTDAGVEKKQILTEDFEIR